jgi:hypothetical protein
MEPALVGQVVGWFSNVDDNGIVLVFKAIQ